MAAAPVLNYETPLLHPYPPILRNRNFLLLWVAYIVSALGDRIQMLVALHLLCKTILHQPGYGTQQSAQLTIAMLAPFALVGPFSGILADRLPRRAVMITADVARALIIIAVRTVFLEYSGALLQQGQRGTAILLALLFGSELLMASFSALFSPARSALLPNLVHPTQLLRANSLTNAAGTIASLLGFIVGGALLAWHETYAMYAGAITFLFSATCISLMRASPPPSSGDDPQMPADTRR